MIIVTLAKPAPLASCRRFLLLGSVALLLLCVPARGEQFPWVPEGPGQTPHRLSKVDPQPSRRLMSSLSVFSRQPHLRKYLDTWPTPGVTACEDWPEYIPEEGEERE